MQRTTVQMSSMICFGFIDLVGEFKFLLFGLSVLTIAVIAFLAFLSQPFWRKDWLSGTPKKGNSIDQEEEEKSH